LDRAGRWLLASGIQDERGGVARYYRSDLRQNLPVSSEITGYAVSAYVYLHRLTGDAVYLDRGVKTARFLTREVWNESAAAFPFEPDPTREQLNYFFDAGIIGRGLAAIWRATGDHEFLSAAMACGRGMLRDFVNTRDVDPILTLPGKRPVARDERWSRNPGCYQLKAAMAWFELAEISGDEELRAAYERVLAWSLATYGPFLPGHSEAAKVMDRLHAYLYFLEGLLPALEHKACAAALCDGIRRVAGCLREIRENFERCDVYSQLLRLRMLAELAGITPLERAAAEEEIETLRLYQQAHGGFGFGRRNGEPLPFDNPVSTVFGMQALAMWEQRARGELAARSLDEHRRLLI
jgi:hypothetical protein